MKIIRMKHYIILVHVYILAKWAEYLSLVCLHTHDHKCMHIHTMSCDANGVLDNRHKVYSWPRFVCGNAVFNELNNILNHA